jgi:hypothetical protein
VIKLIMLYTFLSVPKMPSCKEFEKIQVANIIKHLCHNTPTGQKIKESFRARFGYDILDARARTGSDRGTHYDLEVLINGEWKRVEHKGSCKLSLIKEADVPWAAGVQFYNGGCEKYRLTKEYAHCWYNTHILSGTLKAEWNIMAPIPSFEEFLRGDCCKQDNPTTPFQKELKEKVRAVRPKGSLLKEREPIVRDLIINEEELKYDVSQLANEVLDQKDYWVDIRGDVDGEFNVAWHPKYTITEIESITVKREKDIKFVFNCAGGLSFKGILRWGKGAGFSCLRLDLK